MTVQPITYTFARYLAAKRSVDDRALNRHVWDSLLHHLRTVAGADRPITVLELGGGIGTMVERLRETPDIPKLDYHLLDAEPSNIQTAAAHMLSGHHRPHTQPTPFSILPDAYGEPDSSLRLSLYAADYYDFLQRAGSLAPADLVIAHAFLDLLDLNVALPRLTEALRPDTLLYFTINFDGATILEPAIDPPFDALVEQVYHRTMDERLTAGRPSGDSHTGRHLFHHMQNAGIHVLDAGASDWVVIPQAGSYPHDEAYFLHFIIHTMEGALRHHPDLDSARFATWIAARHAQIERGQLVYIAHQLDYLGIYPGKTPAHSA